MSQGIALKRTLTYTRVLSRNINIWYYGVINFSLQ